MPCEVHWSSPMEFSGTGDEDDETIERYVGQVRERIASLIDEGRKGYERRRRAACGSAGGAR